MSGLDSIQHIVATLRTQIAARETAGNQAAGGKPAPAAKPSGAGQGKRMGSMIVQRVRALDPDDPERGRKTFRIFLESVLLSEFGEDLINDHAFYQMIDAVQHNMEQDRQIQSTIEKAVASLLNAQAGKS